MWNACSSRAYTPSKWATPHCSWSPKRSRSTDWRTLAPFRQSIRGVEAEMSGGSFEGQAMIFQKQDDYYPWILRRRGVLDSWRLSRAGIAGDESFYSWALPLKCIAFICTLRCRCTTTRVSFDRSKEWQGCSIYRVYLRIFSSKTGRI